MKRIQWLEDFDAAVRTRTLQYRDDWSAHAPFTGEAYLAARVDQCHVDLEICYLWQRRWEGQKIVGGAALIAQQIREQLRANGQT